MVALAWITNLYAYNQWANQRILAATQALSPEQFLAPVGASFLSVRDTLAHTLLAHRNWLHRFQRQPVPPARSFADFPDLAALRAAWDDIHEATNAYLARMAEDTLGEVVHYINPHGEARHYTRWQMLVHQVNHATQHRSEVAAMLTQFGHSPGGLDYVVFLDQQPSQQQSLNATRPAPSFELVPLDERYQPWAENFIQTEWGSLRMVTRGKLYNVLAHPGWVALVAGVPQGILTYHLAEAQCEILLLHSRLAGHGIGTALVQQAEATARAANCRRLWLITTNDNLRAIGWYQRRGFTLAAVHVNALEEARRLKPEIPLIGCDGIPLRDELEFERWLPPA